MSLSRIIDLLAPLRPASGPFIVGVTGSVAAGKSTFAQALADQRSELARNLLWIGHAAGIKALLTAEENLAWLCALHRPASREAEVGLAPDVVHHGGGNTTAGH